MSVASNIESHDGIRAIDMRESNLKWYSIRDVKRGAPSLHKAKTARHRRNTRSCVPWNLLLTLREIEEISRVLIKNQVRLRGLRRKVVACEIDNNE